MKEVPLSRAKKRKYADAGYVALVDDEDFERVMRHVWHLRPAKSKRLLYAGTNMPNGTRPTDGYHMVPLHRFIMNASRYVKVDHRNGNGLDCRKENLRFATSSQNSQNQRKQQAERRGTRFKGVSYRAGRLNPWIARIRLGRTRRITLGSFPSEMAAAKAYDRAAKEHFGEFARVNLENEQTQLALSL